MYNEENEAVAKLVQWVRNRDTIWEMICDDSNWYLALEDIIEAGSPLVLDNGAFTYMDMKAMRE